MTTPPVAASTRRSDGHYIVQGSDGLSYRLADHLSRRYGADVTVLMTTDQAKSSRDFSELPRVRIETTERIDERALQRVGITSAAGLALTTQDDVGNIHIALRAMDLAPGLRVVVRMYNSSLGHNIEKLLGNSSVLSDAEIASPVLVAAALGEVASTPVSVEGRTLIVARRGDVASRDVVCGLADTTTPGGPAMLPQDPARADLVLAEVRGTPEEAMNRTQRLARKTNQRKRRSGLTTLFPFLGVLISRKTRIALSLVLGVLIAGGVGLALTRSLGFAESIYLTLATVLGGPQPDDGITGMARIYQLAIGVAGLALVPLITAMIVEGAVNAQLAISRRKLEPLVDHIVVVGLGGVGSRVMRQLHERGLDVVGIDSDEKARGVQAARELGIPLVIGDASRESTLRLAGVERCRALMVLASNDVINLEAALHGRNIKPSLRVVVRLFDGDLASRIRKTFNIQHSRSVSYVAAPAFAEALQDREVIGTFSVERRVLLLANVVVEAGSRLDGALVSQVDEPGATRVVALGERGEPRPLWSPPAAKTVQALDRLTVVCTRDGLSRLSQLAATPVPEAV